MIYDNESFYVGSKVYFHNITHYQASVLSGLYFRFLEEVFVKSHESGRNPLSTILLLSSLLSRLSLGDVILLPAFLRDMEFRYPHLSNEFKEYYRHADEIQGFSMKSVMYKGTGIELESLKGPKEIVDEVKILEETNSFETWIQEEFFQNLKGIKIFISGRLKGLELERETVFKFLDDCGALVFSFEKVASRKNPFEKCREWAKSSPLYIGIYGLSYGEEKDDGLSPTEIEFNEAVKSKNNILIFLKKGTIVDEKQKSFVTRVRDWKEGFNVPSFTNAQDLLAKVKLSIQNLHIELYEIQKEES